MPYVNRDKSRTGLLRKETERKLLRHEWLLALAIPIVAGWLFLLLAPYFV